VDVGSLFAGTMPWTIPSVVRDRGLARPGVVSWVGPGGKKHRTSNRGVDPASSARVLAFYQPGPCAIGSISGPSRGPQPYVSRHGFGFSVFEHTKSGIRSELWVYVAVDAPIKFAVLKVRNESGRPRRLTTWVGE